MKTHYDLVIIGAGPAGMAASAEAVKYGLSTIVLGEQQAPGGQVYRTIEQIGADVLNILGPDRTNRECDLRSHGNPDWGNSE